MPRSVFYRVHVTHGLRTVYVCVLRYVCCLRFPGWVCGSRLHGWFTFTVRYTHAFAFTPVCLRLRLRGWLLHVLVTLRGLPAGLVAFIRFIQFGYWLVITYRLRSFTALHALVTVGLRGCTFVTAVTHLLPAGYTHAARLRGWLRFTARIPRLDYIYRLWLLVYGYRVYGSRLGSPHVAGWFTAFGYTHCAAGSAHAFTRLRFAFYRFTWFTLPRYVYTHIPFTGSAVRVATYGYVTTRLRTPFAALPLRFWLGCAVTCYIAGYLPLHALPAVPLRTVGSPFSSTTHYTHGLPVYRGCLARLVHLHCYRVCGCRLPFTARGYGSAGWFTAGPQFTVLRSVWFAVVLRLVTVIHGYLRLRLRTYSLCPHGYLYHRGSAVTRTTPHTVWVGSPVTAHVGYGYGSARLPLRRYRLRTHGSYHVCCRVTTLLDYLYGWFTVVTRLYVYGCGYAVYVYTRALVTVYVGYGSVTRCLCSSRTVTGWVTRYRCLRLLRGYRLVTHTLDSRLRGWLRLLLVWFCPVYLTRLRVPHRSHFAVTPFGYVYVLAVAFWLRLRTYTGCRFWFVGLRLVYPVTLRLHFAGCLRYRFGCWFCTTFALCSCYTFTATLVAVATVGLLVTYGYTHTPRSPYGSVFGLRFTHGSAVYALPVYLPHHVRTHRLLVCSYGSHGLLLRCVWLRFCGCTYVWLVTPALPIHITRCVLHVVVLRFTHTLRGLPTGLHTLRHTRGSVAVGCYARTFALPPPAVGSLPYGWFLVRFCTHTRLHRTHHHGWLPICCYSSSLQFTTPHRILVGSAVPLVRLDSYWLGWFTGYILYGLHTLVTTPGSRLFTLVTLHTHACRFGLPRTPVYAHTHIPLYTQVATHYARFTHTFTVRTTFLRTFCLRGSTAVLRIYTSCHVHTAVTRFAFTRTAVLCWITYARLRTPARFCGCLPVYTVLLQVLYCYLPPHCGYAVTVYALLLHVLPACRSRLRCATRGSPAGSVTTRTVWFTFCLVVTFTVAVYTHVYVVHTRLRVTRIAHTPFTHLYCVAVRGCGYCRLYRTTFCRLLPFTHGLHCRFHLWFVPTVATPHHGYTTHGSRLRLRYLRFTVATAPVGYAVYRTRTRYVTTPRLGSLAVVTAPHYTRFGSLRLPRPFYWLVARSRLRLLVTHYRLPHPAVLRLRVVYHVYVLRFGYTVGWLPYTPVCHGCLVTVYRLVGYYITTFCLPRLRTHGCGTCGCYAVRLVRRRSSGSTGSSAPYAVTVYTRGSGWITVHYTTGSFGSCTTACHGSGYAVFAYRFCHCRIAHTTRTFGCHRARGYGCTVWVTFTTVTHTRLVTWFVYTHTRIRYATCGYIIWVPVLPLPACRLHCGYCYTLVVTHTTAFYVAFTLRSCGWLLVLRLHTPARLFGLPTYHTPRYCLVTTHTVGSRFVYHTHHRCLLHAPRTFAWLRYGLRLPHLRTCLHTFGYGCCYHAVTGCLPTVTAVTVAVHYTGWLPVLRSRFLRSPVTRLVHHTAHCGSGLRSSTHCGCVRCTRSGSVTTVLHTFLTHTVYVFTALRTYAVGLRLVYWLHTVYCVYAYARFARYTHRTRTFGCGYCGCTHSLPARTAVCYARGSRLVLPRFPHATTPFCVYALPRARLPAHTGYLVYPPRYYLALQFCRSRIHAFGSTRFYGYGSGYRFTFWLPVTVPRFCHVTPPVGYAYTGLRFTRCGLHTTTPATVTLPHGSTPFGFWLPAYLRLPFTFGCYGSYRITHRAVLVPVTAGLPRITRSRLVTVACLVLPTARFAVRLRVRYGCYGYVGSVLLVVWVTHLRFTFTFAHLHVLRLVCHRCGYRAFRYHYPTHGLPVTFRLRSRSTPCPLFVTTFLTGSALRYPYLRLDYATVGSAGYRIFTVRGSTVTVATRFWLGYHYTDCSYLRFFCGSFHTAVHAVGLQLDLTGYATLPVRVYLHRLPCGYYAVRSAGLCVLRYRLPFRTRTFTLRSRLQLPLHYATCHGYALHYRRCHGYALHILSHHCYRLPLRSVTARLSFALPGYAYTLFTHTHTHGYTCVTRFCRSVTTALRTVTHTRLRLLFTLPRYRFCGSVYRLLHGWLRWLFTVPARFTACVGCVTHRAVTVLRCYAHIALLVRVLTLRILPTFLLTPHTVALRHRCRARLPPCRLPHVTDSAVTGHTFGYTRYYIRVRSSAILLVLRIAHRARLVVAFGCVVSFARWLPLLQFWLPLRFYLPVAAVYTTGSAGSLPYTLPFAVHTVTRVTALRLYTRFRSLPPLPLPAVTFTVWFGLHAFTVC